MVAFTSLSFIFDIAKQIKHITNNPINTLMSYVITEIKDNIKNIINFVVPVNSCTGDFFGI